MSALPAFTPRASARRPSVLDVSGIVVWVEDLAPNGAVDVDLATLFTCWLPPHRLALTAMTWGKYWKLADELASMHELFREFRFTPGAGGLSPFTPVHPNVTVGGESCGYVVATHALPMTQLFAFCTTQEQTAAAQAAGLITVTFDDRNLASVDVVLPFRDPDLWASALSDALSARRLAPPP